MDWFSWLVWFFILSVGLISIDVWTVVVDGIIKPANASIKLKLSSETLNPTQSVTCLKPRENGLGVVNAQVFL